MLGKPLSAKQSAALIRSIQRRVPFQSKFSWTGEIVLTRKQVRYANAATITRIRQAFTTEPKGYLADTIAQDLSPKSQPNGSNLSPTNPTFIPDSPSISPDFPLNVLNSREFQASTQRNPLIASLSSDTTRDETRRNSERAEISPTGNDAPSSHHDTGTATLARVVHSAASPMGFGEEEIVKRATKLGEVALWLNDGLTGTILVEGIKRQLVFGPYSEFEHKFYNAHKNAGHTDWWQQYQAGLIVDLVEQWRNGKADKSRDYQFAVSGIYDDRGGKQLADMCVVARLHFATNGSPKTLLLLNGMELQATDFQENKSGQANAPEWKSTTWRTS